MLAARPPSAQTTCQALLPNRTVADLLRPPRATSPQTETKIGHGHSARPLHALLNRRLAPLKLRIALHSRPITARAPLPPQALA